jgi:heterodisulfide reductase subunit A
MLAYGIPAYRLPDPYLKVDLENLKSLGVEISLNTEVGKDISFGELYNTKDAIFIATGLQKNTRFPEVPGSDLKGIIQAGDFLDKVRNNQKISVKQNVVVVGGGNVAIDVARTIKRLGAKTITLLCLEKYEEMPAIGQEIKAAEEEGISIKPELSITKFIGKNSFVEGIQCQQVERIDVQEDGRFVPVLKEGTETTIDCEEVYIAIGQRADLGFLEDEFKPNFERSGLIQTGENTTITGLEKVFAGGDVTSGPSSVIGSIAKGQLAAEEIDCYLNQKRYPGKAQPYQIMDGNRQEIIRSRKGFYETGPRMNMPKIPLAERNDFTEVEIGFTEEMAVAEAKRCLQCGDCSDCRVCDIACEANAVDHFQKDITETIEVGAVVVATGFKEFDPSGLHYGFGKYPDVLTQLQFARMLDPVGPTNGEILRISDKKPVQKIVMIQCAGSRAAEQGIQGGHRYCSRVCCMVALKHAGLVKKYFNPEAEIYICYIDIRAFGKGYEEYFETVKGMGVKFVKGLPGSVLKDKETGALRVTVEDANTSALLEIEADLVVLSSATEPAENSDLMRKLNIARDESGFVKEFHQKIRPTDTMVKNVFVCGAAQGPKDIPDTIAQAGSAASSVASYLGDGYVWLNPMIATVDSSLCRACGRCEEGCEFEAIKVDAAQLCACIEPTMCEGCGKCAVLCPTGATSVHSGTDQQIGALIDGLKVKTTE